MEMLTFVISIDGKLITDPLLLARIFHTDRDEGAAKAYGIRQTSILMPGCMCPYRPSHNVSLTQDPSAFPASAVDECEICGLARVLHTNRDKETAKPDGVPPAAQEIAGETAQSLEALLGSPERARRASPSESTQTNILTQGCMCPYRPSHNVSLTQDPSDFPVSTVDEYEISGLAQFQITHQFFDLNSIHNAQEISVILLPIILGGHKRPTITGSVGPFLKTQEEWVLLNKRVIKNVCYLRYRKKMSS